MKSGRSLYSLYITQRKIKKMYVHTTDYSRLKLTCISYTVLLLTYLSQYNSIITWNCIIRSAKHFLLKLFNRRSPLENFPGVKVLLVMIETPVIYRSPHCSFPHHTDSAREYQTLDTLWVIDLCDTACLQHLHRCFLCCGNFFTLARLLFTATGTVAVQSREAHHAARNR